MKKEEIEQYIQDMPDEVLSRLQFAMPWQYDHEEADYRGKKDEDGFPILATPSGKEDVKIYRDTLQRECWRKFNENPQINTSTRGMIGRLSGLGFETSSEIREIDEAVEEIELDPRNRLYNFMPKYVGRTIIEGELFLLLTCHDDSFVEVDFIDPTCLTDRGDDNSGIIFHPNKTLMPILYDLKLSGDTKIQVPSNFVAFYPELMEIAAKNKDFEPKLLSFSQNSSKKFSDLGGFFRFIVSWDKSFITRRATSYMRTTLQWLNYYENLKKYEIDHKKSAGAYLWIFKITEPKAYKQWLSLTDDERRKTGIMAKKTPGGSLVLPPGVEMEVKNPNLTRITEQDTDILDMIASGLNEPEDVLMNRSKGTFASAKASRGPWNDRTSDEMAYFERFLKYDFWDTIFFLKSKMNPKFRYYHRVEEAVGFDEDGEPIMEKRRRKASQLIDISFPISESIDYEGRARGLMGVKHGPASETLGIPLSEVAKRMGFGNYGRLRLRHATEKEKYPELIYNLDAESLQEQSEAEPTIDRQKSKPKKKIVERKAKE